MKRKYATLALAALAAIWGAVPAFAQPTVSVAVDAAENGRLWFIELVGAPSIEGRSATRVKADQTAFRAAAAKAEIGRAHV